MRRLARFLGLPHQWPERDVEDVVKHAHGHVGVAREGGLVKSCAGLERVEHEARHVDGAKAAAAVRRQRLLAAGIGGGDGLAVRQVVVDVDAIEEEHTRLGVVVGRSHDLVPQLARRQRAVDPEPVIALPCTVGPLPRAGCGAVHLLDGRVRLHGLHEGIGQADGNVEVGEITPVLGVDELLDVRVVAAKHPHLRAAARAGGFHGFAGAIEHPHVRHRASGVVPIEP